MTALAENTKPQATAFSTTDLWMIFLGVTWGINFVLLKAAVSEMRPLGFAGLRFALATLMMLALWRAREGGTPIARRDWPKIALLGIVGNTFYQLFFITAIKLSTASNTSLIVATSPIWVALCGRIFRLDRASRKVWLGILLSFAGLYLIIGSGGDVRLGSQSLLGDLLALGGAMSWALYTLFARPVLARYSSLTFTTWSMVAGAPIVLIAGIPDLLQTNLLAVSTSTWLILVFSATFALSIGYIIWNAGVHHLGQARTANYVNLSPVVALAVGAVFLAEPIPLLKLIGAAVVLAGITLARRG
ncbi:MAG: EamA family transporter [Chloroflexi bacterium]|nr:EamA family transporter [Chloroflexota bacterium]